MYLNLVLNFSTDRRAARPRIITNAVGAGSITSATCGGFKASRRVYKKKMAPLLTKSAVLLAALSTAQLAAASFYEQGHFDRVTKITSESTFDRLIKQAMDEDKTLFVRFIASEG